MESLLVSYWRHSPCYVAFACIIALLEMLVVGLPSRGPYSWQHVEQWQGLEEEPVERWQPLLRAASGCCVLCYHPVRTRSWLAPMLTLAISTCRRAGLNYFTHVLFSLANLKWVHGGCVLRLCVWSMRLCAWSMVRGLGPSGLNNQGNGCLLTDKDKCLAIPVHLRALRLRPGIPRRGALLATHSFCTEGCVFRCCLCRGVVITVPTQRHAA